MQTSPETKNLNAAMVAFHKEVGKVKKDAKNPFFKSSYASLSGILDAIDEPLTNNGLSITQFPEGENGLTTRLMHTSGEWMEATYTMKPVKDTPQDRGSAITYQRRYALGGILSLNIDLDDDGNQASGRTNEKMPIKQAVSNNEDIKNGIKALLSCENVDELKKVKSLLPDYVKANQSFVDAANKRYNEVKINGQTVTA